MFLFIHLTVNWTCTYVCAHTEAVLRTQKEHFQQRDLAV